MFYQPSEGHGLPHDPFKAIVAPRPIGWISTVNEAGGVNLAPYSFFNAFADSPPIVGFSSNGEKHSVVNARATGEFVASLATRPLAERMNLTSALLAENGGEFEFSGLEAAPSRLIAPPRVAESPAALECRVTAVQRLTDIAGKPIENWLVLGQVVGVHIDDAFVTSDGLFDMAAARVIARCGYMDYAEADTFFSMRRP
ncbi:flavin reductase [Agaricicola taiwanensis]|uniref:Flavin reductase n=1 Tax=Agaricicola taiwanensis TaxID=591372 RepID=A0A8J3DVI1_9RHOB|nr:flavin reductase family protein [Agaricicola taiwanensis]GGE47767.1 flavin reductase [Agaricicola taiwanensis]